MRPLNPFLAGLTTLVLLGALGSASAAQDQSGTATRVSGASPGGVMVEEGSPGDGTLGVRGAVYEHAIEWSDSRLPTLLRVAENVDVHLTGDGPGAVISVVSSVRLDGAEGSWTGLEYGLIEELEPEGAVTRLMVLDGAGAYAGLSAMLTRTYEADDYGKPVFEGYIFDAETTPMPDALEAYPAVAEVAAGPAAEPEPTVAPASGMTFVTGAEGCGARVPAIEIAADGSWAAKDSVAMCQADMSDPRVSGAWTNTLNAQCFGKDLCLLWGTAILDRPDGGWQCSWTGGNYPVGEREFGYWPLLVSAVCPGTGGYAGLTYVFQHGTTDFTEGSSFNGVIYEGPPPPVSFASSAE